MHYPRLHTLALFIQLGKWSTFTQCFGICLQYDTNTVIICCCCGLWIYFNYVYVYMYYMYCLFKYGYVSSLALKAHKGIRFPWNLT